MRWPVTTMRAHPLIDPRIDFVFGSVGPKLKQELRDFWSQHGATYRQQLRSFREQLAAPRGTVVAAKPPASRQPAAISRDQAGMINGIVFVGFRELEGSLGLGSRHQHSGTADCLTAHPLKCSLQFSLLWSFRSARLHWEENGRRLR